MSKPAPTVLIIDDEPTMLRLLIDTLEPAGFNVLVALQGDMALVLLEQITPDVILLDAMMPGIDGFETCRRIKQRAPLSLIPVIFMTGLTETTSIVEGLQAGGVDYVTKPVVPTELIARVKVIWPMLSSPAARSWRWMSPAVIYWQLIRKDGCAGVPNKRGVCSTSRSPGPACRRKSHCGSRPRFHRAATRCPTPSPFPPRRREMPPSVLRSGLNLPLSASSRAMNICSASSNSIPIKMSNACNHA